MASIGLIYRHYGKDILKVLYPQLTNDEEQLVCIFPYLTQVCLRVSASSSLSRILPMINYTIASLNVLMLKIMVSSLYFHFSYIYPFNCLSITLLSHIALCLCMLSFFLFLLSISGIDQYPPGTVRPLYKDFTSLSSRVSQLNVQWYEDFSLELQRERFEKAIAICKEAFLTHAQWVVRVCFPCFLFLCISLFICILFLSIFSPFSTVQTSFVYSELCSSTFCSSVCYQSSCW